MDRGRDSACWPGLDDIAARVCHGPGWMAEAPSSLGARAAKVKGSEVLADAGVYCILFKACLDEEMTSIVLQRQHGYRQQRDTTRCTVV